MNQKLRSDVCADRIVASGRSLKIKMWSVHLLMFVRDDSSTVGTRFLHSQSDKKLKSAMCLLFELLDIAFCLAALSQA